MNYEFSPSSDAYRDDPEIRRWLETVGHLLVAALVEGKPRNEAVVRFSSPEHLHEVFKRHVELPIRSSEPGESPERMLEAVQAVLDHAVHSSHPRFFNQNWAGADPVGVLGDWLTALLNTTAATYEMAPVFTLMENELLARMSDLAGVGAMAGESPHLLPGAHGLFTPGGATSNLWAMHVARTAMLPMAAEEGMFSDHIPHLAVFTSEHSHYSIEKAVVMLGLGRQSLYKIPADSAGRMEIDGLRTAISESRAAGQVPFFVNATAGTTVTGAFDPISAIGPIAQAENMWLHVDACYGGTAFFSPTLRHLLDGSSGAQSLSWNAHKMMGLPQQCSVLLVAKASLLKEAFATQANYIFQSDKNHADLDLGDLTLMCGRRSDGLKLWLTWKLRGEAWFRARIERSVSLAEQAEALVDAHPAFALAHPRTFANVGFWWVPPALRPLSPASIDGPTYSRLHALAPRIKNQMQREGSTLLGFQPLPGLPNFFRLLVMSPDVTLEDIRETLAIIDRLGSELVDA